MLYAFVTTKILQTIFYSHVLTCMRVLTGETGGKILRSKIFQRAQEGGPAALALDPPFLLQDCSLPETFTVLISAERLPGA